MSTRSADQRLLGAGWKQTFTIVVCGPNATDDGIRWRDPSGAVFTEPEAIKRLDEQEAEDEEE